ncbi:MAG TPA: circadian clock KaiB family protein [Woeseiaceae bacterium]|nr:circadian clock KaiB family protein [Woeseiaceae bacterium]
MKKPRPAAGTASIESWQGRTWDFTLYIAGQTPRSVAAVENLENLCRRHMAGRFRIEVIDLVLQPELARTDQIVAIPTLVRKRPLPVRRVIGDLSDTERVLRSLDINVRSA